MKSKKCTKCLRRKPLEAFSSCRLVKDGKASWCRACTAKAAKVCRRRKPEHYKDYHRRYVAENPLMTVYKNMKKASHHRRLPMRITFTDLRELLVAQRGLCYWTGKLMKVSGEIKHQPEAVSADRLDLSKPYCRGNVVLCCRWTNLGRNSTPVAIWKSFLQTLNLKGLWSCS